MEQFLGLLVFLLLWIVPAVLRANAKKRNAAQMQVTKNRMNSQSVQQTTTPYPQAQNTSHEIEKMLEKLLGNDSLQQEGAQSFEQAPVHNQKEYESIEYDTVQQPLTQSFDSESLTSQTFLNRAQKLSFEELIAMGEADKGLMVENIDESEHFVHPYLSDFDLKKAVIYAEILKPAYF